MHELSIAQSIIEIIEDNILNLPAVKVKSVTVKIGELTNVLPDSLIFGFNSLISGSHLEGTELIIQEIPLTVKCRKCSAESVVKNMNFICDSCKCTDLEMLSGRELSVGEIEIDEEV